MVGDKTAPISLFDAEKYCQWCKHCDNEKIELIELQRISGANNSLWGGKRVLEIGCGTGRFTLQILEKVKEIVAIDPDEQRVDILNRELSLRSDGNKCRTFKTKLEDLYEHKNSTLLPNSFDIVVFSWSWSFIQNPQEILLIIDELLSKNGIIIATMVVGGSYESFIDDILQITGDARDIAFNRTCMNNLKDSLRQKNFVCKEDVIKSSLVYKSSEEAISFLPPSFKSKERQKAIKMLSEHKNMIEFYDEILCVCGEKNDA